MTQVFPYTIDFAGDELTVYPHRARPQQKLDAYGMRPVTTGGIVIGYFMKNAATGSYHGYDIDRKPLNIVTGKLVDCAKLVATKDQARQAYLDEARYGTFGEDAEAWVRAALAAEFDGEQYFDTDADDVSHDVDVLWPVWNHGAPRAQVMLDNEVVGSVVQCFEKRHGQYHYVYYAQTPDSAQHGVSLGGFDSAVRCLIEHVIDQRQIEAALATVEAPTELAVDGCIRRRDEALQQAWTNVLVAIHEQEAIDIDSVALDALHAARGGLKACAVIEGITLEDA